VTKLDNEFKIDEYGEYVIIVFARHKPEYQKDLSLKIYVNDEGFIRDLPWSDYFQPVYMKKNFKSGEIVIVKTIDASVSIDVDRIEIVKILK
jgi:hypothetical protein